ncbi:MAG: hypothetical protein HY827_01140 [Actinobacteria bacterium]|nr:hypothetical protein [Actinomycetota bacterium]
METHVAIAARIKRFTLAAALAIALGMLAGGCGGAPQDKNEATGTWKVAIEKWVFPKRQPLGTPVTMKLVVRNVDTREMPRLAITIGGLTIPVDQQRAQSRARPIWVLNNLRKGDQTAYNALSKRTFLLGSLAPGEARTFELPLTPIRRGEHAVNYSIAPDLYGKGKAETADGKAATGVRSIAIDPTPNFDESVFD